MHCSEVETELAQAAAGSKLDPGLEEHLAGCAACSQARMLYLRIDASLRDVGLWAPPAGFSSRVAKMSLEEMNAGGRRPLIFAMALMLPVILILLLFFDYDAELYAGTAAWFCRSLAAHAIEITSAFAAVCALLAIWITRRPVASI
jgi:hypothetical protein